MAMVDHAGEWKVWNACNPDEIHLLEEWSVSANLVLRKASETQGDQNVASMEILRSAIWREIAVAKAILQEHFSHQLEHVMLGEAFGFSWNHAHIILVPVCVNASHHKA